MRPSEHYAQTENLLDGVRDSAQKLADLIAKGTANYEDITVATASIGVLIGRAQVHATLANCSDATWKESSDENLG